MKNDVDDALPTSIDELDENCRVRTVTHLLECLKSIAEPKLFDACVGRINEHGGTVSDNLLDLRRECVARKHKALPSK